VATLSFVLLFILRCIFTGFSSGRADCAAEAVQQSLGPCAVCKMNSHAPGPGAGLGSLGWDPWGVIVTFAMGVSSCMEKRHLQPRERVMNLEEKLQVQFLVRRNHCGLWDCSFTWLSVPTGRSK